MRTPRDIWSHEFFAKFCPRFGVCNLFDDLRSERRIKNHNNATRIYICCAEWINVVGDRCCVWICVETFFVAPFVCVCRVHLFRVCNKSEITCKYLRILQLSAFQLNKNNRAQGLSLFSWHFIIKQQLRLNGFAK